MLQTKKENIVITDKSQLCQLFLNGFKKKEDFKIGIEFEKIAVSNFDFKNVPYESKKGIKNFLKELKNTGKGQYLKDNDAIIGIAENSAFITLEPGAQLEYSFAPEKKLSVLKEKLDNFNTLTDEIADSFDIQWLGYGIAPVSTYKNIEIIPKRRYKEMHSYLPSFGTLSPVMMRETAGIQVNIDYENEEDAINKLRLCVGLSPIVSALFANSPIREAKDTGYKSFRANSWLETDENRCGLINNKLFDPSYDFAFNDYIDYLLDIPMIFIVRDQNFIKMNGITFKDFLKNGYNGFIATMEDWKIHSSLAFPDVRLKNYIEIRNHDCQKKDLIYAAPALWKGLLYDKSTIEQALELIKSLNWNELNEIRQQTPKIGLNKKLWGIAQELILISYNALKAQQNNEEQFLAPLKSLAKERLTPADLILKNWYGSWNKDISKLIKYVRI